jgi:hypothetical protein
VWSLSQYYSVLTKHVTSFGGQGCGVVYNYCGDIVILVGSDVFL